MALPGQGKGGIITEKRDSRSKAQESKGMANPDDKPSTLELRSCSKDSRGDESEHLDFKSALDDRSHRRNNVQW